MFTGGDNTKISKNVYVEMQLRRAAGMPESTGISVALPIVYPDWDYPGNKIVTERVPIAEVVTWYGFA